MDTNFKFGGKDFVVNVSSLTNEYRFLTTDEAAKVLGITSKALRNLTSNGKIPYYKFGHRNRYRLDDLVALVLVNKRGTGAIL